MNNGLNGVWLSVTEDIKLCFIGYDFEHLDGWEEVREKLLGVMSSSSLFIPLSHLTYSLAGNNRTYRRRLMSIGT